MLNSKPSASSSLQTASASAHFVAPKPRFGPQTLICTFHSPKQVILGVKPVLRPLNARFSPFYPCFLPRILSISLIIPCFLLFSGIIAFQGLLSPLLRLFMLFGTIGTYLREFCLELINS